MGRGGSHSLEAGVSFTTQIKLRYLHVIRGAEARHGDNSRPNDGLEIVRASTEPQHSAVDKIIITDRCKHTPDASKSSTNHFQERMFSILSGGDSFTNLLFLKCAVNIA